MEAFIERASTLGYASLLTLKYRSLHMKRIMNIIEKPLREVSGTSDPKGGVISTVENPTFISPLNSGYSKCGTSSHTSPFIAAS